MAITTHFVFQRNPINGSLLLELTKRIAVVSLYIIKERIKLIEELAKLRLKYSQGNQHTTPVDASECDKHIIPVDAYNGDATVVSCDHHDYE